jgi:DNA-binding NarL/FixJ family response regulator
VDEGARVFQAAHPPLTGAGTGRIVMGRVLIADEQPLFRDAIRGVVEQFFAEQAWDFVCQEANSIEALMRLADDEDDLDAVLLDLSLLREQGFAELVALRSKLPSVPVIVFSALEDADRVHLCMTCGVVGFIPKSACRTEVTAALRTVFEGGLAVPRCGALPAPGAFGRRAAAEDQECGPLSGRQAAVLDLVTDGKSNKQIAWELSISETTVKAHMTAILRKLGVSSRAQAIVLLQRRPIYDARPYC